MCRSSTGQKAETPLLGESTQGLTCTETQHKAVPPKEDGLDITRGLGGSPGKVGVSYSSPREY